jgi:hypothetical protein
MPKAMDKMAAIKMGPFIPVLWPPQNKNADKTAKDMNNQKKTFVENRVFNFSPSIFFTAAE